MLAVMLALAFPAMIGIAAAKTPRDEAPPAVTQTVTVQGSFHGLSAARWAAKYRRMRHLAYLRGLRARRLARVARVSWAPTVSYALTLAHAVYGVPLGELWRVSWCESTHNPNATNGRYKGLFQLGWSPFGLSPFDPVANALSAAQTVVRDGSWREWQCRP